MRLGDSSAIRDIEVISTGSLTLDIALGVGGVPRGRIVEIYGPESSGKTTLTLQIIAECQRIGGTAAFIDAGAPPPARISTTTNPEFLEKLPYLAAVGESVESGVPIDRIPEMSQIITALSQTLNSIATGQVSREDGLAKAQDQLMNILVQSGRYTG